MVRRTVRNPRKERSASPRESRPSARRLGRLVLRTTTPADLPTLVRHRRRMWEDLGDRTKAELDRADGPYRRWVVRESRAHRFLGFVVEEPSGRVAGSGAVWLRSVPPRPGRLARLEMPYILSMFTEPEFRGRGVASRIVRAMVRWAEVHGYRRVFLHASHMGRPVYAKLGFVDGSEMRLDLPVPRPRHRSPGGGVPRARGRRRGRPITPSR